MNGSLMHKTLLGLGISLFLAAAGGTALEIRYGRTPAADPLAAAISGIPAAREEAKEPATVLFTGDIMLGRYVHTLSEMYGADYPFRKISAELRAHDLTVGNLEGPVFAGAPETPINSVSFSFLPEKARLLAEAGFDALNLGNNHTYDHGRSKYEETKALLSAEGLLSFGHALYADAGGAASVGIRNERLALVGMNATYPSFVLEDAEEFVRKIRSEEPEAFLAVNIHWGEEYQKKSNARQREIAHALADAGADLLVGHHPHLAQEIEVYRGKAIFYSLGNFIFDQYASADTKEGLLVRMSLTPGEVRYELLPADLGRSQPELMPEDKKTAWLAELARRGEQVLESQVGAGSLMLPR